jgi:addiction module HigA family antidote
MSRAIHKFVKTNLADRPLIFKLQSPRCPVVAPVSNPIFTVFTPPFMKTINHPGLLLKEKLRAADIKAKFLAAKIGVANSQFVDILNGKRRITPRIALALEKELGVKALDLVRQQAEFELAVERLETAAEAPPVMTPVAAPALPLSVGYSRQYRNK